MIEQAESLNSELLNGLFYSLGGLNKEISILLCLRMFTKRATFTSALSRRVLSSLHMRCFSLSTSTDLFDRLAYAVLLNPSFTHLKLEPELTKYLRLAFEAMYRSLCLCEDRTYFPVIREMSCGH